MIKKSIALFLSLFFISIDFAAAAQNFYCPETIWCTTTHCRSMGTQWEVHTNAATSTHLMPYFFNSATALVDTGNLKPEPGQVSCSYGTDTEGTVQIVSVSNTVSYVPGRDWKNKGEYALCPEVIARDCPFTNNAS